MNVVKRFDQIFYLPNLVMTRLSHVGGCNWQVCFVCVPQTHDVQPYSGLDNSFDFKWTYGVFWSETIESLKFMEQEVKVNFLKWNSRVWPTSIHAEQVIPLTSLYFNHSLPFCHSGLNLRTQVIDTLPFSKF